VRGRTPHTTTEKEEHTMGGTDDRTEGSFDKAKGNVKEGVGKATGDEDLEREGRKDQAKGGVKQAVGHVKDAVDSAKEGVKKDS